MRSAGPATGGRWAARWRVLGTWLDGSEVNGPGLAAARTSI
jgi:hypothetical protein